jgi:hypothetical protein
MPPPANRRPHTPDAETSVVSERGEAVTEGKAVSEAIIPIPEREAIIAVSVAEREAIITISIAERRPIIPVADRAAELRMGRHSARRSAHAAAHLG